MMAELAERISTLVRGGPSATPAHARGYDALHAHDELITLVDGTLMRVPRANLAAAKELLAAQKVAQRRLQAEGAPINPVNAASVR